MRLNRQELAVGVIRSVRAVNGQITIAETEFAEVFEMLSFRGTLDEPGFLEKKTFRDGRKLRRNLTSLGNLVVKKLIGIDQGSTKVDAFWDNQADLVLTSWEQRSPETWSEITAELNKTTEEFKKVGIDVSKVR